MSWSEFKEVIGVLEKEKVIYDIFCGCPYQVLRSVKLKKYAPNEFCLEQGVIYDKFYIIVEGEADIFLVSDYGKKYYLTTYRKGKFLGELELFDRSPYLSRVEGRGAVVTLEMDREQYLQWLEKDRKFEEYVLRTLCKLTYVSMQKMGEDTLYTLKQRICQYLIENTSSKGKKAIVLNIEELSERMGVTSRSVNLILKTLKDRGIVEINSSKVVVKDLDALIKEKNDK